MSERYRCACCGCHTLAHAAEACPLCLWNPEQNGENGLREARTNVECYGVCYGPSDSRFAVVRHPILGPNGEYAIDRVALRARAYIELRAFGAAAGERAVLSDRLDALLHTLVSADRLYWR